MKSEARLLNMLKFIRLMFLCSNGGGGKPLILILILLRRETVDRRESPGHRVTG